jgi:AP endonuclease-2
MQGLQIMASVVIFSVMLPISAFDSEPNFFFLLVGTRIDYVLASKGLEPWFKYSDIQPEFRGSDHCPVYADFHDTIEQNGPDGIAHSVHIRNHLSSETVNDLSGIAAKNFDEYSNKQKKLSSFFTAKRSANDDDEDLGFTLDSKDGSSVSQSPSSSNVESPVDSQITVVPSVKPSLATATTVLGKKRKKSTSAKPQAKPNQPSLSTFFSLGGSKKSSTSPMSQDSKPSTPADMGTTQTADPNSKEDEFVDVELLIKQHEQTVKAGTQWNALFKPRSAPMCNVHKETCKEFVVNKKGVNHGRRFYLCSR